ncbi:MAG: hypothetical protein ACYC91_03300 [Solirubrobacteraceae bacterium]
MLLAALLALCWHFNAKPRRDALRALPDTLRALAGAVVLFGCCGFGLVRLLLPAPLRRYELLWVLPTGACAAGLALTVLGFAGLPFFVSLPAVIVLGVALGVVAIRRLGWPALSARSLTWPLGLAVLVLVVALIPMVLVQHYAAPTGNGSDAHVAAGSANFLKFSYPTGVNLSQPVNRMPATWKSKYPIYYAFAAVSSLSGLATWQVLAPLAAALLALAAIGMFLVAREVFAVPVAAALAAMGLAGLDRMALHTALHPYFNQTWGFFALPFTLTLGWWVVHPGFDRRARSATAVLLAIFTLVLVLAYPLAAPIPAVPLAVFLWSERRRRIRAGEHVLRWGDVYRGRRSLIWIVPLCAALAVPVLGVAEKAQGAAQVLAPGHSLRSWGGDLFAFVPFDHFFSLPNSVPGTVALAGVAVLALVGFRGRPRPLTWGLGGLLVIGLALALYLRQRAFGYYFHFKLLAFIGPLVMLMAALGAWRLRRLAAVVLAGGALAVATAGGVVAEVKDTGYQLAQDTIKLAAWARSVPRGASIRLDMPPPLQLWAAYFLDARPLCSQLPLIKTDYPHVPFSRKADYIVATVASGRPGDAVGRPLRVNQGFWMFRENPGVPGPSACSRERLDRIYTGSGYSRF